MFQLYIVAIIKAVSSVGADKRTILYHPEAYHAAGGEVFVIAMIISWILTFIFKRDFLKNNPLKDRVGYNNLCVGLDLLPAKAIAAPLFVLIIWLNTRYLQLDFWRAALSDKITGCQWCAVYFANIMNIISWMALILVFVFDPREEPDAHFYCFIQLIAFGYIGYAANFVEVEYKYHPRGSYLFLLVFGLISFVGSGMGVVQFMEYDEETKEKGPVPVAAMAAADYSWLFCLFLKGYFLPKAPAIRATYVIHNALGESAVVGETYAPTGYPSTAPTGKPAGKPAGQVVGAVDGILLK